MAQRPPQPPANLFGFGPAIGSAMGGPLQTNQPPGSQAHEDAMMSLLDSSIYNPFDPGMQLSLDKDGRVVIQSQAQTFSLAPASAESSTAPNVASAVTPAAPQSAIQSLQPLQSLQSLQPVQPAQPRPLLPTPGRSSGPGPSLGPGSASNDERKYFPPSPEGTASATTKSLGVASALFGSTLTEYTKRRDWAARTVEELADLQQILDVNGRVKHVSPSVVALTGYSQEEMTDTFLREHIHPDDMGVFVAEWHESIATGNTMRVFYRLKKKDGTYGIFETIGHGHIAPAKFSSNPESKSPFCQAFFLMSRPYPTKNTGLLDSFLEHKIENERLRRRISELRREESEEVEESQQPFQSQEALSEMTTSEDLGSAHQNYQGHQGQHPRDGAMAPPDKLALMNTALTRENLEGAIAGGRPDSITDKMARYEGVSLSDTVEMLTGLRYQEGERSTGITTGNGSPSFIKGDAGIAIPMDRAPTVSGDKKKKLKLAEEYVCTDCGTLDSPEWRKGPSGPKTLCNACGLRWAKKEKKRNTKSGPGPAPSAVSVAER